MEDIPVFYKKQRYHHYLDARWAVFFDQLGILAGYRVEGFDLDQSDNFCYPTFWLTNQQCWFEVKQEKATPEEEDQAQLLAIYTQKPVYIAVGDVWVPTAPEAGITRYESHAIQGLSSNHWDILKRIKAQETYQEEHEGCFEDDIDDHVDRHLDCSLPNPSPHLIALFNDLHKLCPRISLKVAEGQLHVDAPIEVITPYLCNLVKEYQTDLIRALSYHEGWCWSLGNYFPPHYGYFWCECPICHSYDLCFEGWSYRLPCACLKTQEIQENAEKASWIPQKAYEGKDFYTCRTGKLMGAYIIARQTRFNSVPDN